MHVHTHYSLLDGLAKPMQLAQLAKEQGSPALAITDHGNMHGVVDFFQACKKEGIKPIIGCECFLATRSLHDKEVEFDRDRHHLVLLAKDAIGYRNLVKMVSVAHLEGIYYKPRIDWELLKKNSTGLIALSACLQGEVPKALLRKGEAEAEQVARKYLDLFGEDFFLELQHHPEIESQAVVNQGLIALAGKLNIPLVATNDVHYSRPEDADAHDTLLCIQTNKLKNDTDRMRMGGDFSLRSPSAMHEAFAHVPQACTNTLRIAEKCNFEFDFGKILLPKFETGQQTADEFLQEQCKVGVSEHFGFRVENAKTENEKAIAQRLDFEIETISKMGFASYFLIVWDFVRWAKENGIATGPGRGSAAGSLVSFVLKITDLNPLEHGLFFERFLNPERVSMPDIDLDFADDKRDRVIEFVREKYGQDRVAQICTFGTMAARAAIKDVGRAFGLSFVEMNEFAKLIPDRPGTTLEQALEISKELKNDLKAKAAHRRIFQTAKKLEGCVRHVSVHACAVVISPDEIENHTPLQHPPKDENVTITQFSQKPIEALGLLKMDFLGLKNITIMERAKKIIQRTCDREIDFQKIDIDGDKKTFTLLQNGETVGVFQLESAGMRRYLKELRPTCFDDIVAMVALFRPGPMDNIPLFISGKHNPKKVKYPHPILQEFLQETHGVAVYQEQVQQIAQEFAGFSLGEGYLLIKAVAKKIPELLMEQKQKFVQGALNKGHSKREAEKMFAIIEPFAGYGFNKAHAASYATISCRTAFLKANFPTQFMTALLSCDSQNTDKVVRDIEECERMGVKILTPSVNESLKNFTFVREGEIRFGLEAIKGIGDSVVDEILQERKKGGPFKSLEDFVLRLPAKTINKKSLESLAKSGALSEFCDPKVVIENHEEISKFARAAEKQNANQNLSLFGEVEDESIKMNLQFENEKQATRVEKLNWEKETLGLFVSDHPLKNMENFFVKNGNLIAEIFQPGKPTNPVKVGGILNNFRKITTKANQQMAVATLEDPTGKIDVVLFPQAFEKFAHLFSQEEVLFFAQGKWDLRADILQIVAESIETFDFQQAQAKAKSLPKLDLKKHLAKFAKAAKKESAPGAGRDFSMKEISTSFLAGLAQSEIWHIDLPAQAGRSTLQKLQSLLAKHPGKTAVELDLAGRKFRLKNSVAKTDLLEIAVGEILQKS